MDVNERITKRLRVYGIVQGVGFRPTVSRHAMETGVTGTVCNKGPYVEIFVQGTPEQVQAFGCSMAARRVILTTMPPLVIFLHLGDMNG